MIVRTRKQDVIYFGCSVRMNQGGCDNSRQISSTEAETRVLAALKKYLLAPDIIAAAIEAYRKERQRLSRETARERGSLERELGQTRRKIASVMRAIEDGGDSKCLVPRLNELAEQANELAARLALADPPDIVELHPQASQRYASQVADIETALSAGDAAGLEALTLVRDLISQVRVIPTPRGEQVKLEVEGDLAALLTANEEGTPVMSTMVAGVGFEPTTFRL